MKSFFSLIVIVAAVIVFSMFVLPKYRALQATRASVADSNAKLTTAQKLNSSREDLIAKYNSISKPDLDALATLLPDQVDNIRLIIQLDSLATKNGLSSVRNVTYDTQEKANPKQPTLVEGVASEDPYGTFTISFDTAGQYKNFLSFLSDLERNLRLVDIVSIDFASTDAADRGFVDSFRYRVTLNTYWLKK